MSKILNFLKSNFEYILTAFFAIFFLLTVRFLWGYFEMPSSDQLFLLIKDFFNTYGLIVIFVAAILESILFVGNYFPGSLVIFFGVASAAGDKFLAMQTIFLVCLGMFYWYARTNTQTINSLSWYRLFLRLLS